MSEVQESEEESEEAEITSSSEVHLLVPREFMGSQNLIDASQLKPLTLRGSGEVESGVGNMRGLLGDEDVELGKVKRGGGECSMKTQE